MSSPVSGSTQTGSTNNSSSSDPLSSLAGANDPLANEETFLQLLVSQLQNQDPLDPTDSNQFVSQLTSYSQLEQLINIHSDADSLVTDLGGTTTTPSTTGTSGSSNTNPATTNSASTASTTTNSTGN